MIRDFSEEADENLCAQLYIAARLTRCVEHGDDHIAIDAESIQAAFRSNALDAGAAVRRMNDALFADGVWSLQGPTDRKEMIFARAVAKEQALAAIDRWRTAIATAAQSGRP
ncbi:hypothetical protein [Methylobacterium sp. WSM2598]|uniref:hypothetical protein n=1 Tax=Methylobacterium sp. WSM2598 TaxID=398261 RepID=UPI0003701A96|nr:hypothetical protein [Methylobacterium sp. WSM2598]